jgi:hypothetical protein
VDPLSIGSKQPEHGLIRTALHFHLTVSHPAKDHPKTPGARSAYEEAEFSYEPLFEAGRDKALQEVLEDYLQEEIFFPRWQASKFYGKVLECVGKKVVVVDEEEVEGEE